MHPRKPTGRLNQWPRHNQTGLHCYSPSFDVGPEIYIRLGTDNRGGACTDTLSPGSYATYVVLSDPTSPVEDFTPPLRGISHVSHSHP